MIAAITTAVSVFIFGAFALHQAWADKGGKPVEQHAPDWQGRAIFGAAVSLTCAGALSMWTDKGFLWAALGFALIGYGSFTPVFRWYLNRLRKVHPLYIAPWSNAYDSVFFAMSFRCRYGGWPNSSHVEAYRSTYSEGWTHAKRVVHGAGRWAYAVELTALLIGGGITLAH